MRDRKRRLVGYRLGIDSAGEIVIYHRKQPGITYSLGAFMQFVEKGLIRP
jgi:hypothetical protein